MTGPRDIASGKGLGRGSKDGGHRKDGRPYKSGNTRGDGSYIVGKNRTPTDTRFKVDDDRPRGRRAKGVENADSFFERELNRTIVVRENGKDRKLTKGQGVDVQLIHKANRGDNRSIEMVDGRRRRIAAQKEETVRRYHTLSDHEILEHYLRQRADELNIDPALFGDPSPEDQAPDNG